MSIDAFKQYLESEAGGEWLLMAISGAKTREYQKRYYHYEEPTYSREREEEKKREARKQALETAKPVSFYRADVVAMIKFNNERIPGQHKTGMVSDAGNGIVVHIRQGQAFPSYPVIQYDCWMDIINQGEGRAVDNKGQTWYITLID